MSCSSATTCSVPFSSPPETTRRPGRIRMSPSLQAILTKVIGVACAIMMVTSLSVIAVQRAEHRPGTQVATKGANSGDNGYTAGDAGGGPGGGTDASGNGATAAGPGGSTSAGGTGATAGRTGPGATGGGTAGSGPAAQTQAGGQCKDYNPDQG